VTATFSTPIKEGDVSSVTDSQRMFFAKRWRVYTTEVDAHIKLQNEVHLRTN